MVSCLRPSPSTGSAFNLWRKLISSTRSQARIEWAEHITDVIIRKKLWKRSGMHRVGVKQSEFYVWFWQKNCFWKKICNFLGTKPSSDIWDHLSTISSVPIYHLAIHHLVISMATITTARRCFDTPEPSFQSRDLSPEVNTLQRKCSGVLS